MKKFTAMFMVLVLLMVAVSVGYSSSPIGTTPLSDTQLATLFGMGAWACALTAIGASALVIGAGALTTGTGGVFVASVLAAGTYGYAATKAACQ
jgi:hypothetical protein